MDRGPGRSDIIVTRDYGTIPLDFLAMGDDHPCPYVPDETAREEVFLTAKLDPDLYHDFMDHGFRRSGDIFYRPICPTCFECRSLRVPVHEFVPSKSQRRVLRKNEDINVHAGAPELTDEKCRLYGRYLRERHDSEDHDSPEDLRRFLYRSPVWTLELEYRLKDRLIAVSILDICRRSMSSVYTYFDPDFSTASIGTFTALKEIEICLRRGIHHYYLGFYVKGCTSMNYKTRFRPYELLGREREWARGEDD